MSICLYVCMWSKSVTTCLAETIRQISLRSWEMIDTETVSIPIYLNSDLDQGQGHRVNWSTYIKSNRSQYLFDRCLWIFQEILLLMLCHFSTIQTVTRGSSHIENPIPSFWSCKCVTTCPAETIRQSSLKFWEMIATDPVSLPIYLDSDLDRRSRSQGHLVSLHKD